MAPAGPHAACIPPSPQAAPPSEQAVDLDAAIEFHRRQWNVQARAAYMDRIRRAVWEFYHTDNGEDWFWHPASGQACIRCPFLYSDDICHANVQEAGWDDAVPAIGGEATQHGGDGAVAPGMAGPAGHEAVRIPQLTAQENARGRCSGRRTPSGARGGSTAAPYASSHVGSPD